MAALCSAKRREMKKNVKYKVGKRIFMPTFNQTYEMTIGIKFQALLVHNKKFIIIMIFEIKTTISFRPPAGHWDCDRVHSHRRVTAVLHHNHTGLVKSMDTLCHIFSNG